MLPTPYVELCVKKKGYHKIIGKCIQIFELTFFSPDGLNGVAVYLHNNTRSPGSSVG